MNGLFRFLAALVLALSGSLAPDQGLPNKPIALIVP